MGVFLLVLIVILVAIVVIFGNSIKGYVGELKSIFTKKMFLNSEGYHDFNNIIIQKGNASTQIDHIVVYKYGVFVVETKDMSGWIYGSEKDAYWTQSFPNQKKYPFQNPLRQNYGHIMSLSEYLGISPDKMISIVIFWGDCVLKTSMPENVIRGGIQGYTKYIKSHKAVVFTDEEVSVLCSQIRKCKDSMNLLSNFRHIISTKKHLRK